MSWTRRRYVLSCLVPHRSVTSSPSNSIRPAVWRVSLTMTRPVVVLPEPDSPTSPRTSPGAMLRSMPSTARTAPAGRRASVSRRPPRIGKWTSRPLTRMRSVTRRPRAARRWASGRRAAGGRRSRAGLATSSALMSTAPSRPSGCRWHATRTPSGKMTSGGTTTRQTSIAAGQRGWNRQPSGGSRRSGGDPGIVSSVRRSAWMLGNAPSSFCVYGCRGAVKILRTGPSSATLPAYMIRVRSQVSAMTDRSWVMRISERPSSRRRRSSSSRICAWTMTSSAVVGSSPMTIAGSQARAIAIIARWRIPPDSSWG